MEFTTIDNDGCQWDLVYGLGFLIDGLLWKEILFAFVKLVDSELRTLPALHVHGCVEQNAAIGGLDQTSIR